MRSLLKTCYKFLPLFLGTICTIVLLLALLPGRLDYYLYIYTNPESPSEFATNFFLAGLVGFFIGIPLLCILAIYEIFQIFQHKQHRRQVSGILSLLILAIANLSLYFELPARLYFFTHFKQLERDLVKHRSLNGDCKSFYFQTRSFESGPAGIADRYGFAYLPDRSKTYYQTSHIYDKWYIFKGRNWIGTPANNSVREGD